VSRPLSRVLESLGSPRLLVVGDLILDRYLAGVVERISPEAPIQILRVESESERLGGAGSAAVNVRVLGAEVAALGVLGGDAAATRLAQLAQEAGVELLSIRAPDRRTSVKTRHVARGHFTAQQILRVDEETVAPVGEAQESALRALLAPRLSIFDAILVNDYGKGLLTGSLLRWLLDAAAAAGRPVLVDPYKGRDFARYRGATALTPNRAEASTATGVEVVDLDSAQRAADLLIDRLGLEFALVTLDKEGMFLKQRGGEGRHLPTTPREVFDVTGAGDMVLSVLGMALASGATPLEAAGLANVAAGLEVERVGVVPVTRAEIAARLAKDGAGAAAKRLDRSQVAALCAGLRAAGRRIVFTNGCFDVLHAGHVRYLAQARALGDVLVLGLNGDASVRRLKGADRPLNPLEDRLDVLCALSSVDHVVVFEEDVPNALIEQVVPDVLVKGADWRGKVVEGSDFVESRGGRVVLIDLHEGRSTSGLVDRIRASGR